MNAIVERIDSILKSRNEKRKDLCNGLGIAENTISAWSSRGTIPAADILNDIAIYLDTSIEYLLTGRDKSGFSEKEISLIKSYRKLSDKEKKAVDALIASLLTSENAPAGELKESAPVYRADKKTPLLSKTAANTAEEPAPEYAAEKKKGSLEFLDVGEIIMFRMNTSLSRKNSFPAETPKTTSLSAFTASP